MAKRRLNPRLAKIHHSYSVEELARLFKIHKNTVRNWHKQGLQPNDHFRPILTRGQEVQRFLLERKARRKLTCGPGQIYCLPCRAPKTPAGNIGECAQLGLATGMLQGICPDCDGMIYRLVNLKKLDLVRGDLEITIAPARPRIGDTTKPSVNCDLGDEINDD